MKRAMSTDDKAERAKTNSQPGANVQHSFSDLRPLELGVAEEQSESIRDELHLKEHSINRDIPDTCLTACNSLNGDGALASIQPGYIGWSVGQQEPAEDTSNNSQEAKKEVDVAPRGKYAASGMTKAVVDDQCRNRHEAIGQSLKESPTVRDMAHTLEFCLDLPKEQSGKAALADDTSAW